MFFGAVPTECIKQMFSLVDFGSWQDAYVCCSGGFRIDQALIARYPSLRVHSNDVSVYSCAFGWYATGQPVPLRFVGKLAFMERHFEKNDPAGRVAAVLIASDMARYASGRASPYNLKHVKHYTDTFSDRLSKGREKVKTAAERTKIASYFAGDWRKHVDDAIAAGAGIAAFPPFFKGDYEAMFRFLHENIEWPAPGYDLYDPGQLESIVDRIHESGVPYAVLSDQTFSNLKPAMEYVQGRKVPHFLYASTQRSSLRRLGTVAQPFSYKPVDIARLTEKSAVRVVPADYRHANYLKDIYLAKTIKHTSGLANYFIYLDDMLAGALIFNLTKYNAYGDDAIYLLSDVTTTRDGKISKMIAKMALSRQIIRELDVRFLNRFNKVVTTARSKNPISMKYRGIYELASRRPNQEVEGENILQYVGKVADEALQETYGWWWNRFGRSEVAQARARAQAG